MKILVLSLILAFTGLTAHAGIEPTTAFTHAHAIAVKATLSHLQISESRLGPTVDIARKKNIEGEFADFTVRVDINTNREIRVKECTVMLIIAKNEDRLPEGSVLIEDHTGSASTFINSIHCN